MTTRAIAAIAIAFLMIVVLCSGLATTLMVGGGGPANAHCTTTSSTPAGASPARPPPSAGGGPIGRWTSEQVANAAAIITVGQALQIPARGWAIAVATAMQESQLLNLHGGADDSIGLFQQRPSQGWGSPAQLHDPQYAATKFYQELATIDGWQTMPLTEAAQKVQVSTYPNAYAKWETDATHLVSALSGITTDLGVCGVTVSNQGWTQPVHATVGSGFRTSDRPGHDGVDLIVGKGAAIYAASAGLVSRVRCNAVDKRTGRNWGCDRDGNPDLTAGCGWYVDIDHTGGIVTRYCHLMVRPYVQVGQNVNAGDVIGIFGSSGHSSGPHLHFEVHLGDHTAATAIDPVPFMASVGAPLN